MEFRTSLPPLCLYFLNQYTTRMVLPQLLLLGLRGGAAPAELAHPPAQHTAGGKWGALIHGGRFCSLFRES